MTFSLASGSGPVLAARFEKECDSLRRRNPALLNSFLLLFKPLSFHYHPHGGDRDRRPPLPPQPEMLSTNQMVVDTRHRSSANPAVAGDENLLSSYDQYDRLFCVHVQLYVQYVYMYVCMYYE